MPNERNIFNEAKVAEISLFDRLTEKQKARARRKGLRSIKLDRFLDKLPISQKIADVIRDIYWRC